MAHMADDILKFRAGDLRATVLEQAAERDISVSQWLREATEQYAATPCDSCGDGVCEVCGLETIQVEYADQPSEKTALIGFGGPDETDNPEVQAWIDRAVELLNVGAVGVSVSLDMNPDDIPEGVTQEDVWDDPELLDGVRLRIRHVAIVDTPAFANASLSVQADGSWAGPIVFEGEMTGDLRSIEIDQIVLDETPLPIPVLFDMGEGDHTGPVIGHIDRIERETVTDTADAPVAASVGSGAYPGYLFDQPEPGPMTVHAPDAKGFRRYSGTVAPTGVCHKGQTGCYTYKGASLDYFHSGARIPLDDGEFIRVGPLVFGGPHADGQHLDYSEALARTDDARRVFAMGRMFNHPEGLLFSGVLMPDADIPRIQATAPSVELWPDKAGRLEVKTALQVNQPAWPVAASVGGRVLLVDDTDVEVEEPEVDLADRVTKLESVVGEMYALHLSNTLE